MKPIIGILSNVTMPDDNDGSAVEKTFVNSSYINAIIRSGGVPIIIPVNTDENNIKEQVKLCDGILITGGIDINPLLYKEEPSKEMGSFNPDIDEFDMIAINLAMKNETPILGICRGIQVINVALGGTLYQDLSLKEGCYIKHMQESKKYVGTHSIKIVENSILHDILGTDTIVNSYHHQCIKEVGKNLEPIAYSKDGIIEAIQMKDKKFVVGVEWHPELMIDYDEKMLNIFKKFINACDNKLG